MQSFCSILWVLSVSITSNGHLKALGFTHFSWPKEIKWNWRQKCDPFTAFRKQKLGQTDFWFIFGGLRNGIFLLSKTIFPNGHQYLPKTAWNLILFFLQTVIYKLTKWKIQFFLLKISFMILLASGESQFVLECINLNVQIHKLSSYH